MCNIQNKVSSKEYHNAKEKHIKFLKEVLTKNKLRNTKISLSLRGKKKSEQHKENLKGRILSKESIDKIREGNKGKKRTKESIEKQKLTYRLNPNNIDRNKPTLTSEAIEKMKQTKSSQKMKLYNNGITQKFFSIYDEIPKDWIKGKIKMVYHHDQTDQRVRS
jgi:hypothetical protein